MIAVGNLGSAGLSGSVTDNPALKTLTATDHFSFADIDLTDVHTVSVAAQQGALGKLTASVSHDTTGTGTGGVITWNRTPEL